MADSAISYPLFNIVLSFVESVNFSSAQNHSCNVFYVCNFKLGHPSLSTVSSIKNRHFFITTIGNKIYSVYYFTKQKAIFFYCVGQNPL